MAGNVSILTVHGIWTLADLKTKGYCGNSIHSSSTDAPLADCSMTCAGDPFEYCGNGNRLELYSIGDIPTVTAEPTSK